jgi:hypothetical protein
MREDDVQRVLRYPADHDRLGRSAARPASASAALGNVPRVCSGTTAATSACSRSRLRCTR